MLILTVRTDKPEAEIGLYTDEQQVAYYTWQAHRALAETLLNKIEELLAGHGYTLADLEGLVAYEGPGSFTGLRIGLSAANALAYSYSLPILATAGEGWHEQGIKQLLGGKGGKIALPAYGSPVFITKPRK
jgi:tRNA threonylcarbamoyladenosine biosynthesis protein TsaB